VVVWLGCYTGPIVILLKIGDLSTPTQKIWLKVEKHHIMTSFAHGGSIFQDDNSATTRRQKSIRQAIESL